VSAKEIGDRFRESMRQFCNRERGIADEAAARWKCDDPQHPLSLDPQEFRDWRDFVDRVARPLIEADGDDETTQAAMALYRKASPYFICVSLVMAANRADGGDDV